MSLLILAFGVLAAIWIVVLVGSQFFGPRKLAAPGPRFICSPTGARTIVEIRNGEQRHRSRDHRRRRGRHCGGPAAGQSRHQLPGGRGASRGSGGRAWTITDRSGFALDLGCGWLHSADRNPWVTIAEAQGRTIDKTPPPWSKPALPIGFPLPEQEDFAKAQHAFFERLDAAAQDEPDVAAAALLEPGGRWNNLINAVGTYISGAELDRVSVRDFDQLRRQRRELARARRLWRDDCRLRRRLVGRARLPGAADRPPRQAFEDRNRQGRDHRRSGDRDAAERGPRRQGVPVRAGAAGENRSGEGACRSGLPTSCSCRSTAPRSSKPDSRLFGRTDRSRDRHLSSAAVRPAADRGLFRRADLAPELEAGGERAFFDFAVSELGALLGSDFARRVKPLHIHRWGADPFARGSYSYALPGMADCRATLAAPVDDRLFFAGEACSTTIFRPRMAAGSPALPPPSR